MGAILAVLGLIARIALAVERGLPVIERTIDRLAKAREEAKARSAIDRKANADAKLQRDLADIDRDQTTR